MAITFRLLVGAVRLRFASGLPGCACLLRELHLPGLARTLRHRSFSCRHAGVVRIDAIAWMRRTADGIKSNLVGMVPFLSLVRGICGWSLMRSNGGRKFGSRGRRLPEGADSAFCVLASWLWSQLALSGKRRAVTQDVSAIRFAFGGGLFRLNVPLSAFQSYRMAGVDVRALLITVAIATSIALVAVGSDGL